MSLFTGIGLAIGFASLALGIALFWSVRKPGSNNSPRATNRIAWLLIALFPVIVLFSFFPDTSFRGKLFGFTATGAAALFVFIWWYGGKSAAQAIEADRKDHTENLNDQIRALQNDLEQCRRENPKNKPQVLTETNVYRCPLAASPKRCIGIITGNLQGVHGVDIWVNSENNNMRMSRPYEATISGMIRYLGAKKDEAGEIVEDGVAQKLREWMRERARVEPTTVVPTSPGELARQPYNVKAILHVASVQGSPGRGYRSIENVEDCITNALQAANGDNPLFERCNSIVFPLLGAGTGQANVEAIAQKLLTRAINCLEANPKGRIQSVYFLAWTDVHLRVCKDVLKSSGKVKTAELDA